MRLALVLFLSGAVMAQKIDVSKLGPQPGTVIPEFSLQDQFGKTQTRESILGAKGAMLVFVRSAEW